MLMKKDKIEKIIEELTKFFSINDISLNDGLVIIAEIMIKAIEKQNVSEDFFTIIIESMTDYFVETRRERVKDLLEIENNNR